jgi:uncharacterized protein YndB with AHSA1/START domain
MVTVTGIIRRSPDACWKTLVDPSTMTGWMPNVRRARVVATYPTGLPREIDFELASERSYSLLFTYDVSARELRWKPRRGSAAPGFARVEPAEQGARITYAIEDAGAKPDNGDLDALVTQFASWMHAY